MIKSALINVVRGALHLSTVSRAVKGDRLKICCVSFVGSNPTSCRRGIVVALKKTSIYIKKKYKKNSGLMV